MELSRRELILKCIVEYFIKKAEPIGSHTLKDEYGLDYSTATIRNEMQELENQGFLEKTHTSSGRIPSNKGYRYYIEHLRERDIDDSIRRSLATIFETKAKSIEDVIKESCQILSHMTNLASVVLGPESVKERLKQVSFIPISDNSATAIFVTDKGYVEHKTFILPKEVSMADMEKCVSMLNQRLVGTPIAELVEKTELLKPIITDYVKNNDQVYQAIASALLNFSSGRVNMYGSNNLTNQPEFAQDAERLKKLIGLIEAPEKVRSVIKDEDETDGFNIYIGSENDTLKDVSIVSSEIEVNGEKKGTIALVGPKRMDYDKVLGALEYIVREINNLYKEED